ncbi:hypothetical protein ERJ75_000453100 [Trypanosoma vivax]|nr:hypothetical protein ERJ75_000453100 [Trypanosoma vivax]
MPEWRRAGPVCPRKAVRSSMRRRAAGGTTAPTYEQGRAAVPPDLVARTALLLPSATQLHTRFGARSGVASSGQVQLCATRDDVLATRVGHRPDQGSEPRKDNAVRTARRCASRAHRHSAAKGRRLSVNAAHAWLDGRSHELATRAGEFDAGTRRQRDTRLRGERLKPHGPCRTHAGVGKAEPVQPLPVVTIVSANATGVPVHMTIKNCFGQAAWQKQKYGRRARKQARKKTPGSHSGSSSPCFARASHPSSGLEATDPCELETHPCAERRSVT